MIYNTLLRQIAIAVNALEGTQPDALNATYNTVPLTAANFDSSMHSFNFLKDKMLNAQEGLIMAISSTEEHTWRAFIDPDVTDALAYGARIPPVDSRDKQIVGTYGAVRDADSGQVYTRKKIQQIRDRVGNPNGIWVIPVHWFDIEDSRIYHTGETVEIDVCCYERPDTDTLNLQSDILVPDILGSAIVDGAVMECIRDDEFVAQSGRYGEFYQAWLTAIKAGLTVVESKPTQQVAEKVA